MQFFKKNVIKTAFFIKQKIFEGGLKIQADKWVKFTYYKKLNNEIVIPALREIYEKKTAENIDECGKYVNIAVCQSCGAEHFAGYFNCKTRWCFNCLNKRLLCWIKRIMPILEQWYSEGNFCTKMNFTVRDSMPLNAPLKSLEESFRAIYNGSSARRKKWHERFPGGVRSLEVKLGKNSGEWHPHYHCLTLQKYGEYEKDYYWVSDLWHEILGYNGIVIKKDGTQDFNWNGNVYLQKVYRKRNNTGLINAVAESLKYIVKIDEKLDSELNRNFYKDKELFSDLFYTLKGKRQTSSWGLLYGIGKQIDEDMKSENYEKLIDFVCQKCGFTEAELITKIYEDITEQSVLLDIKK